MNQCERKVGMLVRVHPVGDEFEDGETFTGVYLGDLYYEVYGENNPAILVPELNRIVWGCKSWWFPIQEEGDKDAKITGECIAAACREIFEGAGE